ncbi:hypothetical protein Tco_0885436 [Tanacetum coccineum]
MHTSKDDYLINTLRFVSAKEESQIYGAQLPKSMTNHEMRETKAYKTYLGYATGATPPKKARKFKKPASPQLSTIPVSSEEPTMKSKRVKRSVKKYTKALARGVVITETPEMPLSKKMENVDVTRGKGIELLSDVALTKKAQYEEVRRKSMRDFHKTHPSGSGTVTKTAPSVAKIKPSVTNEGTGVKPGVPDVTEEESSESEVESWGNDEDDINNEQDSRSEGSDDKNTQSDNEKRSNSEHETDENESDSESDHHEYKEEDEEEEEAELVKTPSNDSDDETKITDKAEGDEDEEIDYTTSQLYDDVDIRLNEPVDTDKGFIQEEDIPDAEIVSPMDVQVHHEVPNQQTPTLLIVPVSVITDSSPVYSTIIPQSLPSFTPPPQQSTSIPPPTIEATNPQYAFPNFASDHRASQESTTSDPTKGKKDKDEDPSTGSNQGLKKRKTSKDAEPKKGPKAKESQSSSSKGTKSQPKSFGKFVQSEEPEFEVVDLDMPQDQEENQGNDDGEPKEKVASKRDWFTKPTQPQEPTDPDWNVGKTPQQGQNQSWLTTLASSADKPSKTFDELMSTLIDFSAYIMNGLKITNLT